MKRYILVLVCMWYYAVSFNNERMPIQTFTGEHLTKIHFLSTLFSQEVLNLVAAYVGHLPPWTGLRKLPQPLWDALCAGYRIMPERNAEIERLEMNFLVHFDPTVARCEQYVSITIRPEHRSRTQDLVITVVQENIHTGEIEHISSMGPYSVYNSQILCLLDVFPCGREHRSEKMIMRIKPKEKPKYMLTWACTYLPHAGVKSSHYMCACPLHEEEA